MEEQMAVRMKRLDHVNVRTANLEGMVEWYGRMLGMETGPRPGFSFPGAWLYAGDAPIVHLVGREARPGAEDADLRLEHFAISGSGLVELVERARAAGERCDVRKVPDFPIVQVNLWDPDGNHIHIDFDAAEAEGTGLV
jgi:catechol 2,3-dioxygenase-like lactoylglutathione lyase family enzyme